MNSNYHTMPVQRGPSTYLANILQIVDEVFRDPNTIAPSWKYTRTVGRRFASKGLITSIGIPSCNRKSNACRYHASSFFHVMYIQETIPTSLALIPPPYKYIHTCLDAYLITVWSTSIDPVTLSQREPIKYVIFMGPNRAVAFPRAHQTALSELLLMYIYWFTQWSERT